MQLLWFIPSLAYGLMLAFTSGSYFLLVSSVLTVLVALIVRYRISRRPKLVAQTALRVINNRIYLDDYRMPRAQILWTPEQFDFIFERLAIKADLQSCQQALAEARATLDGADLQFALGLSRDQVIIRSLVIDGPHAILVGSTGSGKTELLRTILLDLRFGQHDAQLICIDFKGGVGLQPFRLLCSAFASDHDLQQASDVLLWLRDELARRELNPGKHQLLVIAIDELGHLLSSVKTSAETLAAIAARGRSAGMHLLMTNQNLVGVSRALLSNIKLRIVVGQPDPVDAAMLGSVAKSDWQGSDPALTGRGQIVGHGTTGVAFEFALPDNSGGVTKEPKQADEQSGHVPEQRLRSAIRQRGYSSPGRARHRQSRPLSNLGWLLRARKAA